MRVSCICPTFGRCPEWQWLIEEAVESFLRQDYEDKELILFNDCPVQHLVCDAPGVVVVNNPTRYSSLGSKYNAAMDRATGELICPWEDDDLSLPWRISQAVAKLGDAFYWNPKASWKLSANGWDRMGGVCHNASIFRKGHSYRAISGNQDIFMDAELRSKEVKIDDLKNPADWSYVFRESGADHLSNHSFQFERYYRENGEREFPAGHYFIQPHWSRDYVSEARDACQSV